MPARPRRIAACQLALLGLCAPLRAQSLDEQVGHWAYAPYLGTGSYRFDATTDVYAIRVAKRWTLREPLLEDDGARRLGLDLRLPVTLGIERDRSDVAEDPASDDVNTLSAVPGVEIEIPLSTRVSIKPLVYAGWGTELGGGDSAWIYWTGLRSRVSFGSEALRWWLIQSLEVVGFSSRQTSAESLLPLRTGLEFRRPLGDKELGGDQIYLDWSVAYTHHLNEIDFRIGETPVPSLNIDDEWELTLAFSKGERPLKLGRLEFERVGLAYRFDEHGDFTGIGLVFRSLFDR